ncbi:unnamed protein product [Didymodactylos carnosus]|uniref:Uncharacterized protein n=1 Tax=Didymodactylos carnosus TaxID=1234261 RepID=A0A815ENN8_9BILA|nr:unnamed protein product [Didymodactylos carnosus]CAF1314869.1 unnamed protein product [Didymodactylos carnosus]CAF3928170.1 unnamed protein product [Didymodactylos carnosus]CAF4155678.1 unnamed protein product [Didymodactylos carnosus]
MISPRVFNQLLTGVRKINQMGENDHGEEFEIEVPELLVPKHLIDDTVAPMAQQMLSDHSQNRDENNEEEKNYTDAPDLMDESPSTRDKEDECKHQYYSQETEQLEKDGITIARPLGGTLVVMQKHEQTDYGTQLDQPKPIESFSQTSKGSKTTKWLAFHVSTPIEKKTSENDVDKQADRIGVHGTVLDGTTHLKMLLNGSKQTETLASALSKPRESSHVRNLKTASQRESLNMMPSGVTESVITIFGDRSSQEAPSEYKTTVQSLPETKDEKSHDIEIRELMKTVIDDVENGHIGKQWNIPFSTFISFAYNQEKRNEGEDEHNRTARNNEPVSLANLRSETSQNDVTKAVSNHTRDDRAKALKLLVHQGLLHYDDYFIGKYRNGRVQPQKGYFKLAPDDYDPNKPGVSDIEFMFKLEKVHLTMEEFEESFKPTPKSNGESLTVTPKWNLSDKAFEVLSSKKFYEIATIDPAKWKYDPDTATSQKESTSDEDLFIYLVRLFVDKVLF